MQRLLSNVAARSLARQQVCVLPVVMHTTRRCASSKVPPTVRPPTAAAASATSAAPHANSSSAAATPEAAQASAPELDAKAAEQVRLAQEIGEQAFGENTEILKQVGYRGLRAFVVCAVGMGAFMWAMKKKKAELAAGEAGAASGAGAGAEEDDDPTQRYLEEMRSLGFDVDTLEEELEQERVSKLAATTGAKSVA